MRWGKTDTEKFNIYFEKRKEERTWKLWFAWYPVRLEEDGRWIWWECIEYKIDNRPGRLCSYRYFYRLKTKKYNGS